MEKIFCETFKYDKRPISRTYTESSKLNNKRNKQPNYKSGKRSEQIYAEANNHVEDTERHLSF